MELEEIKERNFKEAAEKMRNTKDPWKHRSKNMLCQTCMYFVTKEGKNVLIGRCRRHAPTMKGFPVVFQNDWCGEHRLDENSIE